MGPLKMKESHLVTQYCQCLMCLLFLFYRSEQAPGQHVATLKEHDNSIREVVVKPSEVFPVKKVNQTTRVSNFYLKKKNEISRLYK